MTIRISCNREPFASISRQHAWAPISNGRLTGKFHGNGSAVEDGEGGRMNAAMLKDFVPEKQRTGRIIAAVKAVSDSEAEAKYGE